MLRLLKFLGFFGLLVGIIFVLVVYPNRDAFLVVFKNGDGLAEGADWAMKAKSIAGIAEFMRENPSYISYMSISSDQQDTLAFNENKKRTLGFLSGLILSEALITQHQEDIEGFLSQKVRVEDIALFQLPKVYETSHQNALDRLEKEELISESGEIFVKDAIKAMLTSNDLAIHDFFYQQIDDESWQQIMGDSTLSNTSKPLPFLGLYLAIHPQIEKKNQTNSLSSFSIDLFEKYLNDPFFRKVAQSITEEYGKGLKFDEERDLLHRFPQTTASDMYHYFYSIQSAETGPKSELFKLLLEMNKGSYRDRIFSSYAGVFDNRIGLQNGVDWGISTEGVERTQAVFFDELPVGFWFHLSSDLILQDVQQRMIWDRELHILLPTATDSLTQKN